MRHFSSFPMTSHLHHPTLRLVSLHPLLSLSVLFARVPEIHDDFQYNLYISRTTTVTSAIETIVEELGLARSIPIPGAGNLEYCLEEVWRDGTFQSKCFLPFGRAPSNIASRGNEATWLDRSSRPSEVQVCTQSLWSRGATRIPVLCSGGMVPPLKVEEHV